MVQPLEGAHIRGKIVRIGYPGSGKNTSEQGMELYRPGFWTPIVIELNNDDGDLFEGLLQARQTDRDGDEVIASLPVAIRGTKNVFIYVPASPTAGQHPFALRVTGVEGGPVKIYDDSNNEVSEWKTGAEGTHPDAKPLPPGDLLLLDISRQPINLLTQLALDTTLVRPLNVARCAAATLPDSATGLQMVDIVVWDDADPSQLRDISQQQALLDWVQRGGTLVLGAARNWELLSKSEFGALLPAKLSGTAATQPSDYLTEILQGSPTPKLEAAITHVPIRLSQLSRDSISLIDQNAPTENPNYPDPLVYVSSRPYGRGRIVLVAATIQELLHRGNVQFAPNLLPEVLSLRRQRRDENQQNSYVRSNEDPFKVIEAVTGFRVTSGLYFLAAFLFVVVYILVATAGSWSVLRRRGRVQYAWTTFALVAGIASATSLAAVQVIRGIGNRVQQLCVVDAVLTPVGANEASTGSGRAVANCYFGLKTASHVSLDLSLPRDRLAPTETADIPGGLMPLPAAPDDLNISQYSAGAKYMAGSTVGQLWNVPIRATLKQFQGLWSGTLPGQVNASLTRRNEGNFQLTNNSWIENKLDVDLTDCQLLITNGNVGGNYVNGKSGPSRANRVNVFTIGTLPKGKRQVWKEVLLDQERQERKRSGQSLQDIDENNLLGLAPLLSTIQQHWLSAGYNRRTDQSFNERDNELKLESKSTLYPALLVMSTFAELNLEKTSPWTEEMQRSRGFDLDKSEALTTRTALLFGFAEGHPGPVRLAIRPPGGTASQWETIDPAEANTMYRFVIPLGSK